MPVLKNLVGVVKRMAVALFQTPRTAGASSPESAVDTRIEVLVISAREQDFRAVAYHLEQRLSKEAAAALAVIAELGRDLHRCSVQAGKRRCYPPVARPAAEGQDSETTERALARVW